MKYQWFVTLQWNTPQGARTSSRGGTFITKPGDTRETASNDIIRSVKTAEGIEKAVVLFFSLEPDELS